MADTSNTPVIDNSSMTGSVVRCGSDVATLAMFSASSLLLHRFAGRYAINDPHGEHADRDCDSYSTPFSAHLLVVLPLSPGNASVGLRING